MISVFAIIQYNLIVGLYFSLIGYDPKVSHLLARIAISIAHVMKGLWMWGGGGLTINLVDFSVKKTFFLTYVNLSGKGFCDILKFCSTI